MIINKLKDLNLLRTAPELSNKEILTLRDQLNIKIFSANWITIGVMAKSDEQAKIALRSFLKIYPKIIFNDFDNLYARGNVFLKGNQRTGNVYLRTENGLGEGILLTCHYDDQSSQSGTYGPFPLDFFKIKLII